MTKNQIDLTDLQNEVMDKWDSDGVTYTNSVHLSSSSLPPEGMCETTLLPNAELILDNVDEMIDQLGFASISEYINYKRNQEEV